MLPLAMIAVFAPGLGLVLSGDAGVSGGDAPAVTTPGLRRPAPVLPTFPALGVPRSPIPENYPLREAGDGSGDLLYETQAFSARVARDGSVTFKDRRISLRGVLDPWIPKAGPRNVPSLQETILGLARNRKVPRVDADARTDDSYLLIPNLSPYRPDPREGCRACTAAPLALLPLNLTGRFDLTDELMRFSGQDPYRYAKATFLAATRELRIEKAASSHAANLRRAVAELPSLLEQIACTTSLTRRERRGIIEKLRDELDRESPEAHTAARQIEGFLTTRFASPVADDGCPRPPYLP